MLLSTPDLRTARLHLRPVTDDDADDLTALHTDPEVLRFWDSPPWSTPDRATRFVTASRAMDEQGTGLRLVVERREDGEFLGWCSLTAWTPEHRSARVTFCLARRAWDHGYATEAAGALLDRAFEDLDLNRVQTECDTRNTASARVLEKLGFLREGTLRQDCVVDGATSDSWVYGLLRSDRGATALRPGVSPT